MNKFNNLIQLTQFFSKERNCKKHLAQLRWKGGKPICPHCNHNKIYNIEHGNRYKCAKCYKKFSITSGTIFENTKIPLQKWFVAIYIATSHKKGISSHQLSKDIGVTQTTAWFILHRIRETLKVKSPDILEGVVEIDEVYLGGRKSNKHKYLRTGKDNKTPVIGMLQRGKEVRTKVLKHTKAKELIPPILKNVKPGSYIVTDQNSTYKRLRGYYVHLTINHQRGEYVRDATHINTLEGFWSHLKRMITGTYHHISEKHTHRYCDAMSFRYNTRHLNETERFNIALIQSKGKRLKYKNLIVK